MRASVPLDRPKFTSWLQPLPGVGHRILSLVSSPLKTQVVTVGSSKNYAQQYTENGLMIDREGIQPMLAIMMISIKLEKIFKCLCFSKWRVSKSDGLI